MGRLKQQKSGEVQESESAENVDVSSNVVSDDMTVEPKGIENQLEKGMIEIFGKAVKEKKEIARLEIPLGSVYTYWKLYDEAGYAGNIKGLGVHQMERGLAGMFNMPDEDFSKYRHVSRIGCKAPYIVKYEE